MSKFELCWGPEIKTIPPPEMIDGVMTIPEGAEIIFEGSGQSKESFRRLGEDELPLLREALSKIPPSNLGEC